MLIQRFCSAVNAGTADNAALHRLGLLPRDRFAAFFFFDFAVPRLLALPPVFAPLGRRVGDDGLAGGSTYQ